MAQITFGTDKLRYNSVTFPVPSLPSQSLTSWSMRVLPLYNTAELWHGEYREPAQTLKRGLNEQLEHAVRDVIRLLGGAVGLRSMISKHGQPAAVGQISLQRLG